MQNLKIVQPARLNIDFIGNSQVNQIKGWLCVGRQAELSIVDIRQTTVNPERIVNLLRFH